jgi:hypothetical protein
MNCADDAALAGKVDDLDLGFLPHTLLAQCRNLIESHHEVHGCACLPDMLWKARLGRFIEGNRVFRERLRKASTTRSRKKANKGFVEIAASILSVEILASSFAGWNAIYPEAGLVAASMLKARGQHTPLMEFYLYPPKYISSTAIAKLTPPVRPALKSGLYGSSTPQLAGEKLALSYANTILQSTEDTSNRGSAVRLR